MQVESQMLEIDKSHNINQWKADVDTIVSDKEDFGMEKL